MTVLRRCYVAGRTSDQERVGIAQQVAPLDNGPMEGHEMAVLKQTPDSPRWCDNCKAWGDHHTDRCPHTAIGTSENIGILPGGFFARLLARAKAR